MELKNDFRVTICLILLCMLCNCHERIVSIDAIASSYKYMKPDYRGIKLMLKDTLHFHLDENTYNNIKCCNLFKQNGTLFILFYDNGSKTVNIHYFDSQVRVKRIELKQWIHRTKLDKASIFIRNFDSIFVTTQSAFYLLDSAGNIKQEVEFAEIDNRRKSGVLTNNAPPVLKEGLLYMPIRPSLNDRSIIEQQRWNVLYGLDMKHGAWKVSYSLPTIYKENLYGKSFLDYSYCINNVGNFVFSFPADSCIYETNLTDFHRSYYAKSRLHKGAISAATSYELNESYKAYAMRDSYGPIMFDPYHNRYLRQAKQRISEAEFNSKEWEKKRSVIVFNNLFQIIGEFETSQEYAFDSMIFTPDGRMYARTNLKDENALHFVRLEYDENVPNDKVIGYNK